MNRQFARTAAAVFCVASLAGCATTASDKANAPTASSQPGARLQDASANDLPTTLDGEIARAHRLREAGSYEEAAKSLAQLMIVAPDDVRVVGEYGKVLTQLGRPDQAVPFLTRAIQIDANDWTLYSALGVAYDQADQHARARAAYEHALKLRPGQPDVLNNMGVSKMLAGDLGDAKKLLTEAQQPGTGGAKIGNNIALLETMKPATAAPKPLSGVVMQKLPAQSDAAPKGTDHKADKSDKADKVAQAHKPKDAPTLRQQEQSPPQQPVLRTAADGQ
ncbi:MAG TPA: tetratricopeptide repeat protein [Rhizomicrobium sp.]|nr:tetratricopeptide repeat protein [Rhizomicrobium sp.]